MQPGKPVSLYIVIPPSDRDRVRPLVRLLITIIERRLTEEMDYAASGAERQRLLLMLDEFANLGRLEVMEESLAYLAGYGIRAYLVLQDIQQLYKTYSRDETILSHCHIRAAFAPNKLETAQWLSQQTGESTVVKEKVSTSGGRFSVMLDKVSTTYDEHKRNLLTADECMRLPAATKDASDKIVAPGDMIVLVAGEPPIYGKQPMYFLDPRLLERADPAPRVPTRSFTRQGGPGWRRDRSSPCCLLVACCRRDRLVGVRHDVESHTIGGDRDLVREGSPFPPLVSGANLPRPVEHDEYRRAAICWGIDCGQRGAAEAGWRGRWRPLRHHRGRDRGQRRVGAGYPAAAGGQCRPVNALGRRRRPRRQ